MEKSQFVVPDRSVFMVSVRDYRLSGRRGYVVNFKAGVPVRVPPNTYEEALAIGARVAESETVTPAPDPEPKTPPFDRKGAIEDALRVIIARNNEDDYTVNGIPKVVAVMEFIPSECDPRVNSTEIARVFEVLQDNIDLVED